MFPIKTALIAFSFFLVSISALSSAELTEKPEDVLRQWEKFFVEKKLDSILALYSKKAVLVPTFNPEPITNRKELSAYFQGIFKRADLNVTFHNPKLTTSLPSNVTVFDGAYTFSFRNDANAIESIPARYTFVISLEDESLKIVNHHSSVTPK